MQTYGDVILGDYTPTLADLQAVKLADLDTLNTAKSQGEFAWNFSATTTKNDDGSAGPAAGPQTLQMRVDPTTNTNDPQNWLGVYAGALAAVIGGAPTTVLPIKATSNLWLQTTAQQVVQALATGDGTQTGMLTRQSQILAHFGALKAEIAAAPDEPTLAVIDITVGWPD